MNHRVWVRGLLPWVEPRRLLGPGAWTLEGRHAHTELPTHAAADLDARLRGLGIGGSLIEVVVDPPLKRPAIRAARTTDARRRRDTSDGFSRPGARLDAEGRMSLTPEVLALQLGERCAGRTVVDACCGAGGNTIGFARGGAEVVAIERDAARLADARHNARLYGVESRIRFLEGPLETHLPRLAADILFVDPPWGADWPRRGCTLADLPLLSAPPLAAVLAADPAPGAFAEVWLKLPPSFDVASIPGARPEAVYGVADGDARRVKFLLVRRVLPTPADS